MQVVAYPRRRSGFMIPVREQRSRSPVAGHLVIGDYWITQAKARPAAVIWRDPSSSTAEDVQAILFDPVIKSLRGSAMVLSGWEIIDWRLGGRQVVVQEWIVEFT